MEQRELYITSESNTGDDLKKQGRANAYGLGDFVKAGIDLNEAYTIHALATQSKVNIKFNPNATKDDLVSLYCNLDSIEIKTGFDNNVFSASRKVFVNANDTIATFAQKINMAGDHLLGFTAFAMNCNCGVRDPVIMISSKHFGIAKGLLEVIDDSNSLDINYYNKATDPILELSGIKGVTAINDVDVFDKNNLSASNYGDFRIKLHNNFLILLKIKMLNGSPETFRVMDWPKQF